MSSVFNSNHPASKAVDGSTDQGIVHTNAGETSAWWKVDLQTQVQSALVVMYFRTDNKWRRNGIRLYTSLQNSNDAHQDRLCHTIIGAANGTDIPDIYSVTCSESWRYLTVYTETNYDGEGAILDFAEVQVWVNTTCANEKYGTNCGQECASRHCKRGSDSCDPVIGMCRSGCQSAWTGISCHECIAPGRYGDNCGKLCNSRHCLYTSNCDAANGACNTNQCQTGWSGIDCAMCASGLYGDNCNKNCNSRHCLNSMDSCASDTGECSNSGCQTGWTGTDCTVCASGLYGDSCNKNCNSRHCLNCMDSCASDTGACSNSGCQTGWTGTDCTACAPEYYGADCGQRCAVRHCKVDSSCDDKMQGQCVGGCADGYQGMDCTQDCASGKYGPNCDSDCSSRHCKTSSATCDRVGGQCLDGCQVGWMGADCTTVLVNCSDGRYGPGCSQVCSSRNCKTQSLVCDVTGTCPNGCRDGWQNVDCRTPCPSGKYGSNCSKSCDSRQCETARAACDHVTGTCTVGCREGWIGADCTEKCKLGTFGPDCSRCGHCDVTCNVGDGRCPGECLDGFSGDRCDVDVRVSPVTSGIIGGAVVMVVMLLLIGGLICLLKAGRLKWIPPNGTDPTESSKTDTGYTGEISAHAHISGVNDPDYSELNDVTREREEKSQYDVIQNKVYENNQI